MATSAQSSDRSSRAVLTRADGETLRILVVDDEPSLRDVLTRTLRREGWNAVSAASGTEALTLAAQFHPDAVVLDIMLPDIDGYQVLSSLRALDPELCVLFLTAQDAPENRVAGITAGGDDYVTKPFSLEEVLARLRGLVRRAGIAHARQTRPGLRFADLTLDEEAREVRRADVPVDLTATEFELLRFMLRNPRRVLSRAEILDRVWSYDFGGNAHIVELYISYLRKKLDAGHLPLIHTVRGVGYILKADGR